MSQFLNSGVVGNIGLNHMKEIRKQTQAKWEGLGFLEGLKGHIKENVAQLYENQASSILTEATDASYQLLHLVLMLMVTLEMIMLLYLTEQLILHILVWVTNYQAVFNQLTDVL
jgi:hypothetical protein